MTQPRSAWADGALFQKLIDETVDLMRQSLQFVARVEASAVPVSGPQDRFNRLAVVRECSLMTARLTAIMSWLLAQKAGAGASGLAMPPAPALVPVQSLPQQSAPTPLGPQGEALSAQAADLYIRVRRLEQQLAGGTESDPNQ